MESVLNKFLRYVRVDTPSSEDNFDCTPSTSCQFALADMLKGELEALGLTAEVTQNAYVYSSIPANCEGAKAAIGFIAHMDVVEKPQGYSVKPTVHKAYKGGDIKLANGTYIGVNDFPELLSYVGDDIVTSDGSTILGADDKAGVAEIMAMAEYLLSHPEIKHGKIGIAFTPDEEIGHGAKLFDVNKFGCDFAYTVDGEELGEISYETFNGSAFEFAVKGKNIHPGQAKGKMINSIIAATQIIDSFPESERPETTEGREGYYFIHGIEGDVENCKITGIVRDHDRAKFEERKLFVQSVADKFNKLYPGCITLTQRDQYYNCAEVIAPRMHIVENVKSAMEKNGVKPLIFPIRGGTDGSSLSFMGLPCPNICTGGHNAHGTNEFIPVSCMEKVVNILLDVVKCYANK